MEKRAVTIPQRTRPYHELARALKRLREATVNPATGKRFTQPDFAAAAGVSEKYIGQMERGIYRPSPAALRQIVRTFQRYGVPCEYNDLAVHARFADPVADTDPLIERLRAMPADERTLFRRWLDVFYAWRVGDLYVPLEGPEDEAHE